MKPKKKYTIETAQGIKYFYAESLALLTQMLKDYGVIPKEIKEESINKEEFK